MNRRRSWRFALLAPALALAITAGEATSTEESAYFETSEDGTCQVATPGYADLLAARIQAKWWSALPLAARQGMHGAVALHFSIGPDGAVREITTLRPGKVPPFEKAARKAVIRASPFPAPVFVDPQCKVVRVTGNFYYNMGKEAREAWKRDEAHTAGHH